MITLKELLNRSNVIYKNSKIEPLNISRLNTIKDATKDELTFLEDKKYSKDLETSNACAILIKERDLDLIPKKIFPIIVDHPQLEMAKISKIFVNSIILENGIEAVIDQNAQIMKNVFIGKNSSIGKSIIMHNSYIGNGVIIGDNVNIYPNVTIYDNTIIKNNSTIHAGSVIGSDGFGYVQTKEFEHIKIYHCGNVVIEENVEIGANTTIDRAVFGSTIINSGTKIDNLVQIAHNVTLGKNNIIVSQSGIAGSSNIGNNVIIGAQGGVSGHIKIGNNAIIAARGGVTKNLEGGKIYAGFPLFEHRTWLKLQAKIAKLVR